MNKVKKPITMAEIAKICGVSIAAVSYTLNGRDDQRISEETKQKILQIANLYHYRLNPYAKALATGELHNVLFFYESTDFVLYKAEILNFIDNLSKFLKSNNYNLIVAPANGIAKYSYVDAIVTYRISKKTFNELSNKNFVPVIAVDSIIEDKLFFEVNNDIANLIANKDDIYISFEYGDDNTNSLFLSYGNVILVNDMESVKQSVSKFGGKKVHCLNFELFNYLNKVGYKCDYIPVDTPKKNEALFNALKLAMCEVVTSEHKFLV